MPMSADNLIEENLALGERLPKCSAAKCIKGMEVKQGHRHGNGPRKVWMNVQTEPWARPVDWVRRCREGSPRGAAIAEGKDRRGSTSLDHNVFALNPRSSMSCSIRFLELTEPGGQRLGRVG
jgi:hypothetical protein